ncbi:MAG TPA: Rpn family recombination-promoting nuclease/putative transposase [Thermotogota bacterium]|nr:Rpn family recombination-promoting nuclease/putative transposase [Thermotogota bacterium]
MAEDFLKNYLPEEILKHVDLKTLTNQNREYIDKKIHKDFSDLLYQAEIDGKEGYVYFLFEHKSYEDQKVIFQLLRYMTRIWEENFNTKTKKIPIIIPLVIYHGKNVWKIDTRLWKYIEGIEVMPKEIQQMTPDFKFTLYDYSPKSKTEIRGRAIVQAVLEMLKAIRENDKNTLIDGFIYFVSLVEDETDIQLANEIFDLGLVYLMNTEADITKEELLKASLERSDSVQTLAQRLLDEGMEKGMERGIEKGKYDEKLKIALNLQKKGLSIETIAEVTELNPDDVKKLFEKKK